MRPEVPVPVPGSKSETIRALVLGALARGITRIEGAPASGDVLAAAGALRALGIRIDGEPGGGVLRVHGAAGVLPPGDRRVHCGGSATALRMLACVAALREGRTTLTGDPTLRARPAGPLEAPLRAVGVSLRTAGGRPPLVVEGGPARAPAGVVRVDASGTSQVASGLLLLGPLLPGGLRLRLSGRVVSAPYLELTVVALRRAGVRVRREGSTLLVPGRVPAACTAVVEPDWSSAAYPLVAAAVRGVRVRVPGLRARSLQADRAVMDLLRSAGARCGVDGKGAWCEGGRPLRPFRVDLGGSPDLAPAAAALALFADGESRVSGAAHLRAKESDRIAACVEAVRALGGRARPLRDGFVVRGGAPVRGTVDARGDHRIALAFAAAGARVRGGACVRKSWPGGLEALRGIAPPTPR
ncbi:MAG: 3-phosphoshikimate 1-carboxyvinyltransferase [Planctomycetes bacterium]|nr:3-phosphoshikimate 1-carboxyvinyltransferase [Planctomycetota bacterium]